jgi:hypothetical protein
MLKSVALLLSALVATNASLYQNIGPGYCNPSSSTLSYSSLLHHSISTPQLCSETCDTTNSNDHAAWSYYRGFSHDKNGECYCFYDSGKLPAIVEGRTWDREEDGSGEGEIGGSDGTEGVGCFKVIVRETVS